MENIRSINYRNISFKITDFSFYDPRNIYHSIGTSKKILKLGLVHNIAIGDLVRYVIKSLI